MSHTADTENSMFSKRTKDDIKKVLATGVNKQAFKVMIDDIEKGKEDLEAVLAHANASTTLLG